MHRTCALSGNKPPKTVNSSTLTEVALPLNQLFLSFIILLQQHLYKVYGLRIHLSTRFGHNFTAMSLYRMAILLCLLATTPIFAATHALPQKTRSEASPAKLASELQRLLTPVKTLEAHFTQITTDAKGRKLQTTRGIMQIKRPDLFRWQINDPFPQLLISNGKKVWNYDQELQQVTIRPVDQRTSNVPAAILSGNTKNLTKHYALKTSGKADHRSFTLTPKQKDSLFETLILTFNKHHLVSMTLSDSLGTKTTIHFSKVVENQPISTARFTFTPPKKTDVLDETQG